MYNILSIGRASVFVMPCSSDKLQSFYYNIQSTLNTNCPLVLAACHKLGQGNLVHSLHELSKSAGESAMSHDDDHSAHQYL
jgi:hypothetical protein